MGLFFVNFHVQTTDHELVAETLERRDATDCHVLPSKQGWTSVYEKRASLQDDDWIREFASGLSADLDLPVLGFLVHDSDVACYYLYEHGELTDEFNSWPDYFDPDAAGERRPSGGRPEALAPYCRPGVAPAELAAILAADEPFAEAFVERLADKIGIDAERALLDFRDLVEEDEVGDEESDDEDDDAALSLDRASGGDRRSAARFGADSDSPLDFSGLGGMGGDLASAFNQLFGGASSDAPGDPRGKSLVSAASRGDIEQIERLLADGVQIDVEASAPIKGGSPLAGLSKILGGATPDIVLTPLCAAVLEGQYDVVERLLERGANPNHMHQLFGSAIHAAASKAAPAILRLLIEQGGDVNLRNAQGHTPLGAIEQARGARDQIAKMQSMMQSLGLKLPIAVDSMTSADLPTEGWDTCERILRSHGGH